MISSASSSGSGRLSRSVRLLSFSQNRSRLALSSARSSSRENARHRPSGDLSLQVACRANRFTGQNSRTKSARSSYRSGLFFQSMMHVGPIVVIPNLVCLRVLQSRPVVEENDVGLHPLRVKDPGRKAQIVCRSHVSSSLRRMISPAPPSNSTLSGTTTAARPVVFSIDRICWTKFSCLFEVVAQKSCRL